VSARRAGPALALVALVVVCAGMLIAASDADMPHSRPAPHIV
jgi:hypothetical protein